MKTTIINIATDVPSAKGNVVLIELSNKTTLVRTENQFAKDLKKSFLKLRDVKDLIGGVIEGDATFHKAGDKYKATAESAAVIAGEAKEGEELAYAKDGYRVEGFMRLELNPKADMMNRSATAYADVMAEIFGFAGTPVTEEVKAPAIAVTEEVTTA